jgi:diaminopimelate epimerase
MEFIKAHAYGNDFLFVAESGTHGRDAATLARTLCERHTGVGADGSSSTGRRRRRHHALLNADGSHAEVSVVCAPRGSDQRQGHRRGRGRPPGRTHHD